MNIKILTLTILLVPAWINCMEQPPTKQLHPLFDAVKQNNMQEVQQLLDNGADVNATDDNGDTVIHHLSTLKDSEKMLSMELLATQLILKEKCHSIWVLLINKLLKTKGEASTLVCKRIPHGETITHSTSHNYFFTCR